MLTLLLVSGTLFDASTLDRWRVHKAKKSRIAAKVPNFVVAAC